MTNPDHLPEPQSIRAVFFDVGFTLLAPHPSVVDIVLDVCQRRGTPVARADVARQLPHAEAHLRRTTKADPWTWGDESAITGIWQGYFTTLLRPCLRGASEAELADCAREVQVIFDQASSYALYPDVRPVLGAIKARGLTMGVISDWGIGLGLILRHHDLVPFFEFAVVSAMQRRAKPDPALFQTALQRADAIPDYALHIGDSYPLDVLGARAAGITPVLLDRRQKLDPAALDCLVVRDLFGLLDLLEIPQPNVDSPASSAPH
jgi:HAD superfamily hydrolase (TIGR01549 family)